MKINTLLRFGIYGGLFLVPFIPLVVSSSLFFPYITAKNVIFRVLVELITLLWVVLALRDPKYRPKRSWVLYAVLTVSAALTIATVTGINPYRSFWSNYERMDGLVTNLHLLLYFLVIGSVLLTEYLWTWLLRTYVGASVIMSFIALAQYAEGLSKGISVRLDAQLGNATYLAFYMYFHIFLASLLLVRQWKSLGFRILYISLIAIELAVLYLTATRGALLGLLVAIATIAALTSYVYWEELRIRNYALTALGVVCAFVIIFYGLKDSNFIQGSPVLSRFANISPTETTTESRFIIWGMALRGFTEHPLFGWGPENFNILFNKYYEPHLWRQEPWFDRSHNVFLDWLVSAGLVGLASYLALYVASLFYLWKKSSRERIFPAHEAILFSGLLAGYLFQNIFVFDNIVSYMLFFTILAYVHVRVTADEHPIGSSIRPHQGLVAAGAILATLAFGASLYVANIKPVLANRTLIRGIIPPVQGEKAEDFLKSRNDEFLRAISYNTFGTTEAREQYLQFAGRVIGTQTIPEATRIAIGSSAVSEMKKQITEYPDDARYRMFLGSFLSAVGDAPGAIAEFQKALELSPGKQQILLELAAAYERAGKKVESRETIRTAFELDPTNPEIAKTHAYLLLLEGKRAEAEQVLTPLYGNIAAPDPRFVNYFLERKEYQNLLISMEGVAEANPSDIQLQYSLAAAYLQVGERAQSVIQLKKIGEQFPQQATQTRALIGEIEAGRNPIQE